MRRLDGGGSASSLFSRTFTNPVASHAPLPSPLRSEIERTFSVEALDRMAKAIVNVEAKKGVIKDLKAEGGTHG